MHHSGVLFDHVEKNVLSKLDQRCAPVVYCSVCKAVDGTHFIRHLISSDHHQAHQYHNKIIIMMDCHFIALRVEL